MIEPVNIELLEALAASAPAAVTPRDKASGRNSRSRRGSIDLGQWIVKHGLEVDEPKPWNDGQLYPLRACVWNPDHTNGSAWVAQFANGALAAGCQHESCKDKKWEDLRASVEAAGKDGQEHLEDQDDQDGDRPTILITTDEPAVVDQAIESLTADDTIFTRGNMLARIARDNKKLAGIVRPADAPRIESLPQPTLRELMAGNARWIKLQQHGENIEEVSAHPPDWAVKAAAARGAYPGIPPLEGVVETPILRPDGTILDQPGYDAATGLLYEPSCAVPAIPDRPTLDDAMRAIEALLEVVEDFPFAMTAHKSGWIAAVLTPLARYSFHGPVPMFTADANTRGSGKTLSFDAAGIIVSGSPMARMVNPESDDEMRKRITTLALEGERMILLDNIGNVLGCPSLDAALTATSWKDRILGVNQSTAVLPINFTVYATGNNIVYNGDTVRRVVPIRIQSDLENPEERTGFRHPNLLQWVRQERGRLVAAALTILRAYHVAGRPRQNLSTWGSFEEWSAAVRGPIKWAGLDDPAIARKEFAEQNDREAGTLQSLMVGWEEIAGGEEMTAGEVLHDLQANSDANRIDPGRSGFQPLRWHDLRAAIAELSGKPPGFLPTPQSFGLILHHLRGRVVGGQRFVSRPHKGTNRWKVESAEEGTSGTKGADPTEVVDTETAEITETEPGDVVTGGTKELGGGISAVTPACTRTHARAHTREPELGEKPPFSPLVPPDAADYDADEERLAMQAEPPLDAWGEPYR